MSIRRVLMAVVLAMASQVAIASVIAHYSFDGNALDSVGNNHGTLHGDTTFDIGVQGQAVQFDGNSDYVLLANPILGALENWSVTGYVYLNDTQYRDFGEQRHSIYGEYSAVTNANTDNYMSHSDDVNIRGLSYDTFPPEGGATTTDNPLDTHLWYSFAYVRDGSDISIYIDGQLAQQGVYEQYSGDPATVGAFGARLQNETEVYEPSNPTKYSMSGMLDEVTFYDHSISVGELPTNPVPAPPGWALLGVGLIATIRFRRQLGRE